MEFLDTLALWGFRAELSPISAESQPGIPMGSQLPQLHFILIQTVIKTILSSP